MYITTSRKPSDATRKLARAIANFIGLYENRGKKSISEVVTRADELGESRAIIISERGGKPDSLSFISIDKEWGWIDPEIIISCRQPLPETRRQHKQAVYKGEGKYSNLFDLQEPDTDDVVLVEMDDRKISFSYGKSKLVLDIRGLKRLKMPSE